jgi:hypothetical protein
MTGIEAALLELVQVAEAPLYSAYAWLGREFAQDKLRLWSVDPEACARERLSSIPADLADRYEHVEGPDAAFDPFGLSLTLGSAATPDEEPDWTLNLDFEAEQFGLDVVSGKEGEALAQAARFFPDVEFVERQRSQRDHRTKIVGSLIAGQSEA